MANLDLRTRLPFIIWRPLRLVACLLLLCVYVPVLLAYKLGLGARRSSTLEHAFAFFSLAGDVGRLAFSELLMFVSPYTMSTGLVMDSFRPGNVALSLVQHWNVQNPYSSVHAAALFNLGEFAVASAVVTALDAREGKHRAIPTSGRIEYLAKARGKITCKCVAVLPAESGRHANVEHHVELVNARGEAVARMTVGMQVDLDLGKRA